MPNDQFKIPGQYFERPLHETRIETPVPIDALQYTPEKQPELFRTLTDDAEEIWSYRDVALETDHRHKKGLLSAFGWIRHETTTPELIKVESKIGGDLYGKDSGRRFWLADKAYGKSANQDDELVAHWFYTHPVVTASGKIQEITLHYENRPTSLIKWFNGKPYAVSLEETENVCKLIPRYKKGIREQLYPIEDSIHEWQDEIDQEHIIQPDTNEIMFSKQVVDRMVAEYRAKQAYDELIATRALDELVDKPIADDSKDDYPLAA